MESLSARLEPEPDGIQLASLAVTEYALEEAHFGQFEFHIVGIIGIDISLLNEEFLIVLITPERDGHKGIESLSGERADDEVGLGDGEIKNEFVIFE